MPTSEATQALLTELRDIHLPAPVSWWPPAPGWFWLTGIILVAVGIGLYNLYRHRNTPLQHALNLIESIQQTHEQQRNPDNLVTISTLVRRIALQRFPREDVANLYGNAWLAFLDNTGKTNAFTQGPGRCLAEGPYQMRPQVNWPQLFVCIKQWIKIIYV